MPRRNVGLPGAWTVLLLRAVVVHPAGCGLPSPCCGETAVAFRASKPLGTRNELVFVAAFPRPTRSRDYVSPATSLRRRKARYRLGGLTLRRAGLAPAGRCTEFHEVIATSILSDQPCLVTLNDLAADEFLSLEIWRWTTGRAMNGLEIRSTW